MSQPRVTRSNSLNSRNNNTEKDSKVRKSSELSPDLEDKIKKKPKALTREMERILEELAAINKRLDKMTVVESKIDIISADLSKFKKEFEIVNVRVNDVELRQAEVLNRVNDNQVQLNIINQVKLDDQLMITDVPTHINKDNFINNVNDWSRNLLQTIGYKKLILAKTKKTNTAFLHFWNYKDKSRFLEYIKSQQKKDDEYIPITNGEVFKLNDDDVDAALVLHFQTPMTKINQGILREARSYKKERYIERCWLMEGSIYIRKTGHKAGIRIDSIEHLKSIVNGNGSRADHANSYSAMETGN